MCKESKWQRDPLEAGASLGMHTTWMQSKVRDVMERLSTWRRVLNAGASAGELQELEVEGTSFNPGKGGVVGLASLPTNLQARTSGRIPERWL